MGKGGEQPVANATSGKKAFKALKLEHMPTEELRKWAKAYNVDSEKKREDILQLLNPFADGIMDKNRPSNPPIAPPPFTLMDLKNAIPKHCFERHLSTSLGYLGIDLVKVFVLGYLATYISNPTALGLPQWAPYVLWPIYWWAQGCTMMGIWVLSHECGHQSFSESEFANNLVGTIFHSLMFVPYHPWRITHGKHHNNTGSCDNDEVFSPFTREDWGEEMLRETPLANFWGIFVMFTVGWIPGYLVMNITGPAKYRGKNANHFSPTAVFFTKEEYWLVVQSVSMVYAALAGLAYAIYTLGFITVGAYYLVPYLIVNMFLVLLTFLQHTDVYMPHFRGKEWNWFRGAICTIDRSYGFFWDRATHHITDTHVCHHLFSKMPFYHAQEATEHIKRVMGDYYKYDPTPIPQAVYRAYHCCQFIEAKGDIEFYKNVK